MVLNFLGFLGKKKLFKVINFNKQGHIFLVRYMPL